MKIKTRDGTEIELTPEELKRFNIKKPEDVQRFIKELEAKRGTDGGVRIEREVYE